MVATSTPETRGALSNGKCVPPQMKSWIRLWPETYSCFSRYMTHSGFELIICYKLNQSDWCKYHCLPHEVLSLSIRARSSWQQEQVRTGTLLRCAASERSVPGDASGRECIRFHWRTDKALPAFQCKHLEQVRSTLFKLSDLGLKIGLCMAVYFSFPDKFRIPRIRKNSIRLNVQSQWIDMLFHEFSFCLYRYCARRLCISLSPMQFALPWLHYILYMTIIILNHIFVRYNCV